jgi:hypothetical protein
MRFFSYVEPICETDYFSNSFHANYSKVVTYSEDEIIDMFYESWKKEMEKIGKAEFISKEECILDWVAVHWAWESNKEQ